MLLPLCRRAPPARLLLSTSHTQNVSLDSLEFNLTEVNWFILPFVTQQSGTEARGRLFSPCLDNQGPPSWREAGPSYYSFILVIKKHPFSFCELFCSLVKYKLFSSYWDICSFIYIPTHSFIQVEEARCVLTHCKLFNTFVWNQIVASSFLSTNDLYVANFHYTVSLNDTFSLEKRTI